MAKKARGRSKGAGTLVLRGKTWFARWQVNGKVFTKSTGTASRREAEKILDEFVAPFRLKGEGRTLEAVAARLGGVQAQIAKIEDEAPATSIFDGWQAYIDQHNRPDTGESTLGVYELQYEAFARWYAENYPERTDSDKKRIRWQLRDVTQEQAERYAGHLLKRVSASTFNRHINLLTLVWRVLEETARLSVNPWKKIGRKRFQVHSRRELTLEELGRVCEAAQGEMRLLLAVGIYTGLRLGDAACLDWGSVDMMKGIISVVPSKTARRSQKRVTIPIHATLFALLADCPENRRKGFVMPKTAERYHVFDGALAKDVAKLFQSVGIETRSETKGQRARVDCGFHSLRHTFVSLCAAGGIPQSVVQSLVGHGSPAMTQHYTHIGIETAKNAVDLLPDVTKEPATANTETEAKPDAPLQVDATALMATLRGMTAKTWKADRDKLVLALTKSMPDGTVG